MNNHKSNNSRNNEQPKIRNKTNNPRSHDSDTSLRSSNSRSSYPEERSCVFVRDLAGYGFKITGNAPVKVQAVRLRGSAWNAGLREHDIILKVNGENVINKQHGDVVGLIRKQTTVDLLVRSGEDIHISSSTHIPSKVRHSSPLHNPRSPPTDSEKSHPNIVKPTPRNLPLPNISIPKNDLHHSNISRNSPSNHSILSTESIGKSSNSSTDCSISTSSTETDYNQSNNSKINKPIPINSDSNPRRVQSGKPLISTKPTSIDLEVIQNKHMNDRINNLKIVSSPPEKDIPIKSHSYNATSNKQLKSIPNVKKLVETIRNKTIPPDGVKSNNLLKKDKDDFNVSPISYSTLPKQSNRHILGRDFDDDNSNEERSDESLSLVDLLSSTKDAIARPGIAAILLYYVYEQPYDLNIMILYYACQFYKSLDKKKEFQINATRFANEIITTFVMTKSPLFVSISSEMLDDILKVLRSSENMNTIFNALTGYLFQCLETIIDGVRGKIQRGISLHNDSIKLSGEENRDSELVILQRELSFFINKNIKVSDPSDEILARNIGLATMYQYFYKPSLLQHSNMRSRSTDGLNTVGNQGKCLTIAEMYKLNIFCSIYEQKFFSSTRKKPKTINGHTVSEAVCLQPEDCAVCENILWGPSPQGLLCSMCQSYFHMNCKKKIKNSCIRKSRKSMVVPGTKEVQEKPTFLGRLSRKSSTVSVKNLNTNVENNNLGNNIFNNGSLIPNDKSNAAVIDDDLFFSKAKSEDQLHRINSNPERVPSSQDLPSLNYNNSMESNVEIQELVADASLNDPDMNVNESFDAGAEIQAVFPMLGEGSDIKRLIVLLEFYHKTRYILMNLKRFHYMLVNKWPSSQVLYSKALSLDCILPFVNLIKSLVTVIESSITEQGFVDLEKAVLEWLSEKNDNRLKEWITLSSNLCCTNSLHIVKQLKQTTMRTIPELIPLLNVKLHKMIIVEELTQIRPLLISLPLIVKNIIKSLSKSEHMYQEELAVWKEVSIKMDYLCEYIDRCCIPLVDWINNGSICKRSEKNDWPIRYKENENISQDIINYCLDFPRTLFHFPIFDFQMAKIVAWSRNTTRLGMNFPINYLKKGTEVLLIFYKRFIVVLQKENEHYFLKPIKPFKNITERIFPIIEINESMATNGGQEENYHILNIINKNFANSSLIRVGFSKKEFVDNWLDYFGSEIQNLSRSISLYKLNDIKEMPNLLLEPNNNFPSVKLRYSQSFSNSPSNIASPVESLTTLKDVVRNDETPPLDESLNPKLEIEYEPEIKTEIKPEHKTIENTPSNNNDDLLNGMIKASETIYSLKKEVSDHLNIPEDNYDNTLEFIRNQGPNTLQDLTLLLYSVCGPVVDLTRHLLSACSEDNSGNTSNVNKEEIKKTLASISNIVQHFDSVKDHEQPKINEHKNTSAHRNKINSTSSISRIKLVSDLTILGEKNNMTPNEIMEDVKGMIDGLIDKSVDEIEKQTVPTLHSYKYSPEKCLISKPKVERSSICHTPSYYHINSPIEETITTTRAQIILTRNVKNVV